MCGPELIALAGTAASAAGGASTLIPLGLGVGSSLIGGQLQANAQRQQEEQQLNQNLQAEYARNQVLQRFLATQKGYQKENQGVLDTTIDKASQPKLAATQAAGEASRIAGADSTVAGGITANVAPPSSTGSNVTQNDLNARTQAGLGRARASTGAAAKLGAYSDANSYLGNNAIDAGRRIGTTNEFSRGDAALLPSQQQFADFEARVGNRIDPLSTYGSTIQGLGNVFAALAGTRRYPSANPSSTPNPYGF